MKLTKQILFPTLLVALTACTTVATSSPETVYVTEEVVPEEEFFSQAELDQMLAPIALYPDVLLSQVLMAATYPLEVVEASRWSKDNPDFVGDEAVIAVENFNWDISVKTLVAFPDLIQLLDENLTWTRQLGDAFLMQEGQVMDTVQQLRQRSLDAGNLASLEHVRVQQEEEVIIIEPADVRVVYVPYYRPTIVYGDWWWYDHPPYYWDPPRRYYSSVGFHWGHGFHWSTGFHISTRFYFSFCDWHRRSIVVHHHHHRYGRHDWDRVHHRPYHAPDTQVWKHNPHHRRGVDYRSNQLQTTLPRHSSSGKTTKPIMARPSRNPDDTQNNILTATRPDSRRGSTQAGSGASGNVRPERPERPSPGGRSGGSTVAASRSTRVNSGDTPVATTRSAPVASRSQNARVSPSDRARSSSNSRPVNRSSSSNSRYSSTGTTSSSKAPVVNRSSSTTRPVPQARSSSSQSSSRPSSVARSSSGSTRSAPQARSSSSSRSSSIPKARTSSSSSRPSSVSRSSGSSTRSAPQARSSSSSSRPSSVSRSSGASTRSAPQARSSSSNRSSSSASRSSSYSSPRSSSSNSSSSRTSSSSGGSYSRPSAPSRSSGSSSSRSRYSGGDDGGFRRG